MVDLNMQKKLLKQQLDVLQQQSHQKMEHAEREWRERASSRHQVIITTWTQARGSAAARTQAERLQEAEQKCQDNLVSLCLQNIRLQMEIHLMEGGGRGPSEGLQHIDFEQLKMENQTYSEKIEERNEDLNKFRRKISNTVQVWAEFPILAVLSVSQVLVTRGHDANG